MQIEKMDYYLFICAVNNYWKHFDYSLAPGSISVEILIIFLVEIWADKLQGIEKKIILARCTILAMDDSC